jgi:hypothetical protein
MLVESRVGANITEDGLLALDEIISPLVMRGQSVHHIVAHNPDQFEVSEKSIYRYVAGGLLKARNIDMPRVCRTKPRKSKPVEHKIDSGCRIGRTYAEFLTFMETSGVPVVEMDSVVGRIGGKVLLTMMFKSCDLMLAFIRERNTSQSVIDIFNSMYELLGADRFKAILSPYNPKGTSRVVNFTTTKDVFDTNPKRSHISHVVCDSDWEAELARMLEHHPSVIAYVKNQGLGLEVPYRDGSTPRRYIPDFVVRLDVGTNEPLNLILETKGYRKGDAQLKAETMKTMWVPGVNNLSTFGNWAFEEFTDVFAIESDFSALVDSLSVKVAA